VHVSASVGWIKRIAAVVGDGPHFRLRTAGPRTACQAKDRRVPVPTSATFAPSECRGPVVSITLAVPAVPEGSHSGLP